MRLSPEPLFSEAAIQTRVAELAAEIAVDHAGETPLLVGVLKGAIHFLSDLHRAMPVPAEIDFISARSYIGMESSGTVDVRRVTDLDVAGRRVVLVEDILDTGRTAARLLAHLGAQQPASLKICTLLDKPERREVSVHADYSGFEIPDRFVVGYGLDHDQRYRELRAIHTLDE